MMIRLKLKIVFSGVLILCSACVIRPPPTVGYEKGPLGTTYPYYAQNWKIYTVRRGDTLYRIARSFRKTVSEIVQLNGLQRPYTIYPGQTLRLELVTQYPSGNSPTEMIPSRTPTKEFYQGTKRTVIPPTPSSNQDTQCYPSVPWQWPTQQGNYERSRSQTGNEGIVIWGQVGQPIKAAAGGRVTYSGSGYGGYLNLIIIEHNEAFLSVYAFNRKHWVRENTYVTAGQTIAEMGTDGSGRAMLHFEIRCHGKALDPLSYLPQ